MQYIRYEACGDLAGVKGELDRLVEQRFVTAEQAEAVSCETIFRFFDSEFGAKLRMGNNVLREFKFSILDDAGRYGDDLDNEQVLLQGVVDCALVEDDGITIVDFKTDRVTDRSVTEVADRYRTQIDAYAQALSRIYQTQIKEKYLYLFHLGEFVQL